MMPDSALVVRLVTAIGDQAGTPAPGIQPDPFD
jgi:hypothetical protein